MGRDAWERAATDAERELMVMLLEDALAHGSLGMSTNWFDTDRNRELVPSRLSDDAELDALDRRARPPSARHAAGHRTRRDRPSPRAGEVAGARRAGDVARRRGGRHHRHRPPGVPARRWRGAVQPAARVREHDRGGGRACMARDDQRPRREQARPARRRRVAGAGAPRLGPPARRAERLPQGAAARADPLRLRERHRPGGRLAEGPRRGARPASVGRTGRLGARERHRVALHEALGPAAGHPARDGRAGQSRVRRSVRAHRRHRRRRAPQHVLRRGRERVRAHALGPRRGRRRHRAGRPLHDATERRLLLAPRPRRDRNRQARRPRGVRARRDRDRATSSAPTTCPTADGASRGRARASAPRSSAARPPCSTASPPAHAPPPSATPSAPPARPARTNLRQQTGYIPLS